MEGMVILMSVARTIVLEDAVDEDIDSIRKQLQKALLRPVTKLEVTQEAVKIGVKVLMEKWNK